MRTELEKKNNKWWLHGYGNDEADIMIICSHPSKYDLTAKQLFVRSEDTTDKDYTLGEEVAEALRICEIDPDNCWFTSMVKYGLGNKDKPTAEQIAECAEELDEEIAKIKPKLIITLGAEVFKRIMKTNIAQTDYIGEIIDCPYGKVMANYSPQQVYLIDPKLRPDFISNFNLAKRFVNGTLKYTNFEWLLVDDPALNTQILQHYIDNKQMIIGYDLEWKGKFMVDEKLYCFQYCCEPNKAIILPILNKDGSTNDALLNSMKLMLERDDVKRVGWNIRADDKRLRLKGFNLLDETLYFDGMKSMAFFDSRNGKGLEEGIKRFTNYKPYYNALNKELRRLKKDKSELADLMFDSPKIFWEYCAGDAVSHYQACINMKAEFDKLMPKPVKKYFYDTYLPLTHYLTDMELSGLPIDVPCLTELTRQYKACYNLLYEKLMAKTKAYGFDDEAYNASVKEIGEEKTLLAGLRPTFNPRSHIDKVAFFFNKLKLTPAYYVRKGKAKPKAWYDKQKDIVKQQYSPSANGKSIASIKFQLAEELSNDPDNKELQEKYNVVKNYLDLARVSVFSNKFLSTQGVVNDDLADDFVEGEEGDTLKTSYWAAMTNERIHPDFYECLDNFRSSSRPNVQNPASKVLAHIPGIFKEHELEVPKNIRNIFYSGHPDWHFAEVDVAGADLAIAAFLSKDPLYIKDILNGNFHTKKMRDYFKDPKLTKDDASKYVTAKAITFRVAYTAGLMSAAIPIQAEIYAESGNFVDLATIEYALRTWNDYSEYMAYRRKCEKEVDNCASITNERGIPYYFERTDEFRILAGWKNQALAYPIASELALFIYDVSLRIKERLKKDGNWLTRVEPINCVHDACIWRIHKDIMKDNYFPELCKQYFTKEVKIVTGDNLGMEMIVSDRWKGKEKVFAKETAWNFTTKEWEWKK